MRGVDDILLGLTCEQDWMQHKNFLCPELAKKILDFKKLPVKGKFISITTSTNAVCFIDEYVIKIFAPQICGYQSFDDLQREIFLLNLLGSADIKIPRVIDFDRINYIHTFYFCILEKINIIPFSKYLDTCSRKDVITFGRHLEHALTVFQSLNIERPELSKIPPKGNGNVFVHSDLTADNVLYDGEVFAIIDFEDWQYSCADVELPSIAFELLPKYPDLLPEILNIPRKDLTARVYNGIQAHEAPSRFESKFAQWALSFDD